MKKLILTLAIALMASACGPAQEEVDSETGLNRKDLEKIEEAVCNGRALKRVDSALTGNLDNLADGWQQGMVITLQKEDEECLPKSAETGNSFRFIFQATCLANRSAWRVTKRTSDGYNVFHTLEDFGSSEITLRGVEAESAKEFATKTGAKVLRCE